MARKKSNGPKAEKKITRYTYDHIKEPRTPETGHTPLLPAEEQVVRLPMDNGWSKAIHVGKLPEGDERPVVVDMDPAADPVLFWAGKRNRREVPEYPVEAVREAVINAIVHADYSIGGSGTKVAIFDDRIEITNPGLLPFGLTLDAALAGVSRLRNRVIGRVFRELKLIEQWGSGLGRIYSACKNAGLAEPRFEELGANFRVTLFGRRVKAPALPEWQSALLTYLEKEGKTSTQTAAKLWRVSDRAARMRLRRMVKDGMLIDIGSGPRDPYRVYVLREKKHV